MWGGSKYFLLYLDLIGQVATCPRELVSEPAIQYTVFNVFVLYLMSSAVFISDDLVSIIWIIGQINTCPRELVSEPGLVNPGVFVTEF